MIRTLLCFFCSIVFLAVPLFAEEAAPPAVEDLGNGKVRIGSVTVDRAARSASFPAKVNMDLGYVEYALVTEDGKTHESLLSTPTQPEDLHAAMLLLGVKGSPQSRGERVEETGKPATINADYLASAKLPAGDPVTLAVTWSDEGTPRTVALEDWILNEDLAIAGKRGPWIYNGSEIFGERFMANQDGSLVTLVTDSFALINNPREGHNDDLVWRPNKAVLPPLETPVTVTVSVFQTEKPKIEGSSPSE